MAWSKPRKPVCLVLLLLTNQLAGFPAPILFRFAYFCHAFPVNKYLRNSPARTKNLVCWIINLLLDVLLCSIAENFLLVFCILTRPTGSSKYGTTSKNTQRYYTTKRLRYMNFMRHNSVELK